MQESWVFHWIKCHSQKRKKLGSSFEDLKPRAWVIRVPASYIGLDDQKKGFQTVIQALDEEEAIKMAQYVKEWEILDFSVTKFQIFPKYPTVY